MSKHTIELIDAKLKEHAENADKSEREQRSYENMASNARQTARFYRDLIAQLEADKSTLEQQVAR